VLRARLATAAVAIPVLLALILYPSPWPLAAVVAVVAIIGLSEYADMAFAARRSERRLTIALGTVVVLGAAVAHDLRWLVAAVALTVSAGLVHVVLARSDFEDGLRDLGVLLIGVLYVALLLPHFIWLRAVADGPRWIIFVLAIGMAGDAGGYIVGHAVGRHKLAPRISPNKTVEGALGIMAASLLAGAISKLVALPTVGWTEALLLSAVMGLLGQLGDLSESVMKRTFGVKESGALFPGHGGVLDRIDSLLFPVAFLYYHVAFLR